MPRRLTRTDPFRLLWIFCSRNHYSIPLSPLRRIVLDRMSLCGLRKLICVDTFRRGHSVGFLMERLTCSIEATLRKPTFYKRGLLIKKRRRRRINSRLANNTRTDGTTNTLILSMIDRLEEVHQMITYLQDFYGLLFYRIVPVDTRHTLQRTLWRRLRGHFNRIHNTYHLELFFILTLCFQTFSAADASESVYMTDTVLCDFFLGQFFSFLL